MKIMKKKSQLNLLLKEILRNEFLDKKVRNYLKEALINFDVNIDPYISNMKEAEELKRRILNDIKTFKFDIPDIPPSVKEIEEKTSNIDLVVSCRGDTKEKNKIPSELHSKATLIYGNYDECKNKKIVIYVHGYNVDRKIALKESNDLFSKIKSELRDRKIDDTEYKFILLTWPGDAGVINFNKSQEFAEFSGKALHELFVELKSIQNVKKITLIAHSLGAHVTLKSASMIKGGDSYDNVLLLGPAIEADTLIAKPVEGKYHFPTAIDAISNLDIVHTKTDIALEVFFTLNELEKPLGRFSDISEKNIKVKIHDLTPNFFEKFDSGVGVNSHLQYWENKKQVELYTGMILS